MTNSILSKITGSFKDFIAYVDLKRLLSKLIFNKGINFLVSAVCSHAWPGHRFIMTPWKLALCGESPLTKEQWCGPVMSFDVSLNKLLIKESRDRWIEMLLCPFDVIVMYCRSYGTGFLMGSVIKGFGNINRKRMLDLVGKVKGLRGASKQCKIRKITNFDMQYFAKLYDEPIDNTVQWQW